MEYSVYAESSSSDEGTIEVGENNIAFGVTAENNLPSPADLLVSAFAACCLKNVERFSVYLNYSYDRASISVEAVRKEKPPMIEAISYEITIRTKDEHINTDLLQRNLQKFGTIYNTLNQVCDISGSISVQKI